MSETMYDYYLSQADYMKKIIGNRTALLGKFADFYAAINPDRIYLVGSGTSLNSCNAAYAYMEKILGIEVSVIAPSRPCEIRGARPMIIAASQGGRSTNTINYIKKIKEKHLPAVTLTASLDTPLARLADCALEIGVGDETAGPKTRGYTGTVLSLYLMALEAGLRKGLIDNDGYDTRLGHLRETAGYGKYNMDACQAFYEAHRSDLGTARHYLFVGKGVPAMVANEDALKVLETLCYPSAGYEFEEYLHGPACCTDAQTALFIFLSDDEDRERMLRLSEITASATKNSYIITNDAKLEGDRILNLKSAPCPFMSPFTDILLGQLISALLTAELNRSRHPAVKDIFAVMDTKVPAV